MREDDACRRAFEIVGRGEHAPQLGDDAQHVEYSGAHHCGAYALRVLGSAVTDQGRLVPPVQRHVLDGARILLVVEELMPRDSPRVVELGHGRRERHETVGAGERKRAQHDRVEQRVDRHGRREAERERDHGGEREAGLTEQHAQCVAHASNGIRQPLAAGTALVHAAIDHLQRLAHGAHIAKLGERSRSRFMIADAFRPQRLDALCKVKRQLVVDVGIGVGAEESQIATPERGARVGVHRSATTRQVGEGVGAAFITLATAATYCSHDADSARSALRPAAVSW